MATTYALKKSLFAFIKGLLMKWKGSDPTKIMMMHGVNCEFNPECPEVAERLSKQFKSINLAYLDNR